MNKWFAIIVAGAAGAAGCAAIDDTSGSSEQDVAGTTYVSIVDFNSSALQGSFYDLNQQLNGEFNALCGDTFCEGDYANLTPLTLMCSVSSVEGSVHDCAWTFAGSLESVNDKTAAITVDAPTYECHFKAKTTAAKLVSTLQASSDAIHLTLPGETTSINDALVSCFEHPLNHTPITFTNDPSPTYVEAASYYTSAASQAKWTASLTALVAGFNNICGDTFCSSDYDDLSSLAFVCSVTKSTGNVKGCDWVFGGSISEFNAAGTATPGSKSWTCPVAMKGTLAQLIAVLTPPVSATDPSQPIDRALPGMTTSAYDALGGCLP